MNKSMLRQQLRSQRRQLSPAQQQQHALELSRKLIQFCRRRRFFHIAVYLANDGEISMDIFIKAAWRQRLAIYLPVVGNERQLHFRRYDAQSRLVANRFGIMEPQHGEVRSVEAIDLICLPLVGFDSQGRRLGMGGGFYDYSLRKVAHLNRPYRLGIAHQIQECNDLEANTWDIDLMAILTEQRLIKTSPRVQ